MNNFLTALKLAFTAVLSILVVAACTFQKPVTELPVEVTERAEGLPQEGLAKSFFLEADNKTPKTFLCGFAPITEMTDFTMATMIHNFSMQDGCNIEFEISEKYLIGRMVNPSYLNEKTRWKMALKIPITKHYYFEKKKDSNGRDTNEYFENTQRSHWSKRPYMSLDLYSMEMMDSQLQSSALPVPTGHGIKVEDVEWDLKTGFLGFTFTQSFRLPAYGIEDQARIRFNLLRFKHNPSFVKTPYNDKNAKLMNVLHLTGEKVQGVSPILYAAKWDLNKTHDIYLIDFPPQHEATAEKVIEEWNQTLIKLGAVSNGKKVFQVRKDKKPKHSFDLRYNSIHWVTDQKINRMNPILGIAMGNVDVRNGEILWGGINLHTGTLDEYLKGFMSTEDSQVASKANTLAKTKSALFNKAQSLQLKIPTALTNLRSALAPLHTYAQNDTARFIISDSIEKLNARFAVQSNFTPNLTKLLAFEFPAQAEAKASDHFHFRRNGSLVSCSDLRVETVARGVKDAIAANKVPYEQAMESIVKELISHEYGHFLGLGHQFKENILPDPNRVPPDIYQNLKAKAEKNLSNSTSIMGYRHPRAEIVTPPDEIVPGPQDELVLTYLYKRQYATYKTGDKEFKFFDLPTNGMIPKYNPEKPEYITSYFPQCNDMDASYSLDPYCNRFDMGYNATTIVDNYLKDLKSDLVHTLFTFNERRGGNVESAESRFWQDSLKTLGRLRLFYDYMRYRYNDVFNELRKDEKLLYNFAGACNPNENERTQDAKLDQIFANNPGLKELCQVNLRVLNEIEQMVSLNASDFTRLDMEGVNVPGNMSTGDSSRNNYSHFMGTWTELGASPLKISALYALSTPDPWVVISDHSDPSNYFIFPIPQYSRPDFRFSYASLYPTEYTKIIAATTKSNLFFSKDTTLGKSEYSFLGSALYSLTYFNYLTTQSNDSKKLPIPFSENLKSQSEFDLSFVALILKVEDHNVTKKRFSGVAYDFRSGKEIPLTEIYILPEGRLVARGQDMFIYPLPSSHLTFISETQAYSFAYKVSYSKKLNDPLAGFSVKTVLQQINERLLDACTVGSRNPTTGKNNGLSTFFNAGEPKFAGFKIDKGIPTDGDKQKTFLKSIEDAFNDYYKSDLKPNPSACSEAIRGIGLIVSTAALLNSNWIPEVEEFLEK